jgi:predicted membrane chloride channel (bestrophin family)
LNTACPSEPREGLIVELLIGREQVEVIDQGTEASLGGGIALGFFVGFRNDAACARWLEGRQL